ncbi:MAG: outer membrane beta-barrel protein [Terracidiphilus sp.]
MYLNTKVISSSLAAAAMTIALTAGAQAPAPPADSSAAPAAPAQAPAPAAAPAAPTWSVGPLDVSGMIDGYYSFNFNRPNTSDIFPDQVNQLYNFDDKTDQFELSSAKLTLNHAPDPVGADIDFIYGRTNDLINNSPLNTTTTTFVASQLPYLEQAFISLKPAKAKGFELDFGKWVTSAGAEVIESYNDWNYSRSLLFVNAIPYWHFGARTSMPISKTDTVGFQLFNGWNNVSKSNGGVSGAFTNALVEPKYSWFFNYLVGPENSNTDAGLRNLFDSTLLLTPPGKFNAYVNFDYGMNQNEVVSQGNNKLVAWYGVAGAFHEQANAKNAISGRFEWFDDANGNQTGTYPTANTLYEGTVTYEYKWIEGALMRVEYRIDKSNLQYFEKLANQFTDQQQTVTVAFIAFFGPKR